LIADIWFGSTARRRAGYFTYVGRFGLAYEVLFEDACSAKIAALENFERFLGHVLEIQGCRPSESDGVRLVEGIGWTPFWRSRLCNNL
jgi:hypothetical protein